MNNKHNRKIDNYTFARAFLMHADGLNWDEISKALPPFTKSQLENSVMSFKHDIREMRITKPTVIKTKQSFIEHEDTGCYKSPSCFNCTEKRCIYDIKKSSNKHHWSQAEEEYLKKEYPNKTSRELALYFGIPESAVRQHVSVMGLSKRNEK